MGRIKFAGLGVFMLGAALAWWWPVSGPADDHTPARAASETAASDPGADARRGERSAAGAGSDPEPLDRPPPAASGTSIDYGAQLRTAGDYLEFAQKILPAARDGDAAAQFHLSRALGYCESLYEWYFIERSPAGEVRHRTLDEAQQLSAVRPFFSAEDIRDIQSRCQKLRSLEDSPFGASSEWFDAALAQRFPMAQAHAALNLALRSGPGGDAQKARIAREEARRLAFEALRTPATDVLMQISGVSAALAGNGTEDPKRGLSWMLAASLRDENSAELREWMRMTCRVDTQCQPYESPADVILRRAGNDRDQVERQARDLQEKLDAGTLTESDIG